MILVYKLLSMQVFSFPINKSQHLDCTQHSQDSSACHQLVYIYTPWRWTSQLLTICSAWIRHRGPLLDGHIDTLYIIMTFGRVGSKVKPVANHWKVHSDCLRLSQCLKFHRCHSFHRCRVCW